VRIVSAFGRMDGNLTKWTDVFLKGVKKGVGRVYDARTRYPLIDEPGRGPDCPEGYISFYLVLGPAVMLVGRWMADCYYHLLGLGRRYFRAIYRDVKVLTFILTACYIPRDSSTRHLHPPLRPSIRAMN
jgi:hypothetical protein